MTGKKPVATELMGGRVLQTTSLENGYLNEWKIEAGEMLQL